MLRVAWSVKRPCVFYAFAASGTLLVWLLRNVHATHVTRRRDLMQSEAPIMSEAPKSADGDNTKPVHLFFGTVTAPTNTGRAGCCSSRRPP